MTIERKAYDQEFELKSIKTEEKETQPKCETVFVDLIEKYNQSEPSKEPTFYPKEIIQIENEIYKCDVSLT